MTDILTDLKKLRAAASPGPWKAAVFAPGDGTGQVVIYDANDHPIFFVVDQNPSNAQLAALVHPIADELVASQEALGYLRMHFGGKGWPDRWGGGTLSDAAAMRGLVALRMEKLAETMK